MNVKREELRALDAEIAETVMGWEWRTSDRAAFARNNLLWRPEYNAESKARLYPPQYPWESSYPLADERHERVRDYGEMPGYSTNMGAAWLVIERMHTLGWWCRLLSPWRPDGQDYEAGFTPHETTGWNGRPDHRAVCAAMPEAVCRAAIAAVRGGPHTLSEWPTEEEEGEHARNRNEDHG